MISWLFTHPKLFRLVFNFWPPFWLVGIKMLELAQDYSYARLVLKWRPWTRNVNGSQFGGSLFAMIDPIYSVLLLGQLGWDRYYVWDKSAQIDFRQPGRGPVYFEARVEKAWLEAIKQRTATGGKDNPVVCCVLKDGHGHVIAEVHRTLYVRLRPAFRPPHRDKGSRQTG